MTELLTAAQMRSVEAAAIASGEVTGLDLMERAGQGVVEAIFEEWPELGEGAHKAVVLCGPGNNGGDGFVVARLLKDAGWTVEAFLYGDADKLPPDARVNYERWGEMGEVEELEKAISGGLSSEYSAVVIDAVFGIGLTRALTIPLSAMDFDSARYEYVTSDGPHNVAIDIPSGLHTDSGLRLADNGNVFFADLTVTFHRKKRGHIVAEGPECCGKVILKDIGLSKWDQDCRGGK